MRFELTTHARWTNALPAHASYVLPIGSEFIIFIIFYSQNGDLQSQPQLNHTSQTNENVTFGKRDYNQLSFSYLNDLDRSDAETTTEL